MKEAERILNASTDQEVLQAEDNASRDGLRNCYHSIFQRIEGNENEPAILNVARRRLYFAYSTLLRYCPYEEIKNSADINVNEENNTNTESKTSNDAKFLEAMRIMSATSNLDVLEAKDGSSADELKECMKKVMSRVTKTTNEDNLVKESRNRVQRAYEALLRSAKSTIVIPVKDTRLMEAERIINASSDSEVLQIQVGASKKRIRAACNVLNTKLVKTKDEDRTITQARLRVYQAHSRLLAAKSEEKKKRKLKKAMAAKKTNTSTQTKVVVGKKTQTKTTSAAKTTLGGTPEAISVEKWVADNWN